MVNDPKHTTDENGVLLSPRFIRHMPLRTVTNARVEALRKLIAEIQTRPNTWAAVVESDSRHLPQNAMTYFKKGKLGNPEHWDSGVRKDPNGNKHTLYVKWTGPKP